ncbi:MAG: DUF4118 domain-containing protein [Caulobacteraceae bacterium]
MTDFSGDELTAVPALADAPARTGGSASGGAALAVQYGSAVGLVAIATLLAFVASNVVASANLTLIFVLPVVVAAAVFGWGPSVAAIAASLLAYDFFFTRPYFTLRMDDPRDIWAAGLLLVTAGIVSTVAGQSRRRALAERRAAERAEALQSVAHLVIERRPQAEIVEAAAAALSRAFATPAVIFSEVDGRVTVEATAGGAAVSEVDLDAAKGAVDTGKHIHAETYPYDRTKFDFWPVRAAAARRYVLAVDFSRSAAGRPSNPDRFVEIVGAYVAIGRAGKAD